MRNYIILALLILSFSNAFTQENPYEIFGLESKVKYETKISEYLTVKNTDTNSAIKSMVFNMDEEVIIFLGNNDTILKTVKIKPEQLLRFLSVDPLTKDYPWYTPYQFAGNKPIMAIDLDGLEENVVIYQDKGEGKTFMRSCKYSDLYPGQKHGPFGKTGTAIVVLNTFANDRNTYVDADVQYQFINNKNKLVSMDMGKFDIYKEPKESWYKKNIGNKLEGGAHGDPGTDQYTTKQDLQVSLGVLGIIVTGGLAAEGYFGAGAVYSLLTDIDQCTTDKNGDSFIERQLESPTYKAIYNGSQVLNGSIGKYQNLSKIGTEGVSTFKAIEHINSTTGITNDAIGTATNINETKK